MPLKDKIKALIRWSQSDEVPEYFDDSFLHSMDEKFSEWGNLSPRQEQALDNIVDSFHIDLEMYR